MRYCQRSSEAVENCQSTNHMLEIQHFRKIIEIKYNRQTHVSVDIKYRYTKEFLKDEKHHIFFFSLLSSFILEDGS